MERLGVMGGGGSEILNLHPAHKLASGRVNALPGDRKIDAHGLLGIPNTERASVNTLEFPGINPRPIFPFCGPIIDDHLYIIFTSHFHQPLRNITAEIKRGARINLDLPNPPLVINTKIVTVDLAGIFPILHMLHRAHQTPNNHVLNPGLHNPTKIIIPTFPQ